MTSDQWGMVSSLLLMVVTVASIALTYRKSRQRSAANSIKKTIQPTMSRTTTVPPSGVIYGASSGNDGVDAAEPEHEPSTPDPEQFQKDMDAHSPGQMPALNDIYRGQWLEWRVIFKERKTVPDRNKRLLRFLEENTIINVTCEIDANQFPQVEHWRTNEPVRISGTIELITDEGIRLEDIDLEQK